MTTTKTAAATLSLTQTACRLLHNSKEVTSHVLLNTLDPSADVFAVAHCKDPQDASMSFTIAHDRITIFVHEPVDLVLASKPELELNLPVIEIVARYRTSATSAYRLGASKVLAPPTVVTRSGSDTDLIIGINLDGRTTVALPPPDGSYCQLSWCVNSLPRSLQLAATSQGAILKPKRQD